MAGSAGNETPGLPRVTVRQFEFSDLQPLLLLEKRCFPADAFDAELFKHYARRWPQWFLVAECQGRLVGYAMASGGRRRAELASIAVHPDWQGRGIALALLQELERRLAAAGLDEIRLCVRVTNSRAIRFYRRAGFQELGTVRHYYADGSDALRMHKRLELPAQQCGR